ncbi:MAG: D-alanyl-D-alanine carboxypeptidase [Pseudomonadota bacterium]|nr:D-alanyl-D-alanine carboxypeptidase [Pseudomonadota bacterium]
MRHLHRTILLCAAAWLGGSSGHAAEPMAPEVMAALRQSGVPLKNFGFYARPVEKAGDDDGGASLTSLNAEQTFLLASTTKVVTSLAALDLLGPAYSWPLRAHATGPVVNGQLRGDLVIEGNRHTISAEELRLWFRQMRIEGLQSIGGQLVLEGVLLVPDDEAADTAAALEAGDGVRALTASSARTDAARTYDDGSMVLSIEPTSGERAKITLTPKPLGVVVVNEVLMGGTCDAWARWSNPSDSAGGTPHLWVRGLWDVSCPKEYVAYVRPLPGMKYAASVMLPPSGRASAPRAAASTARTVAALWAEAGGTLRGRVIEIEERPSLTETSGRTPASVNPVTSPQMRSSGASAAWSSAYSIPLAQVVREINKTSDNVAARSLLLSLSSDQAPPNQARQSAKNRIHEWLRAQGLVDGDIRVDLGSGQSREERGKPRAMVQLLCNAWRAEGAQAFVNSLPIAGVDGTLVNRMRNGLATGEAFLKTGTLSDTRALAGYVRSRSGVVYAVTAIVNHPDAARARPVLDVFIAWLVKHG